MSGFSASIAEEQVLIVDDNEFNLQLLGAILTDAGYVVVEATAGQDALNLVENQPPSLILLDIMMPGMSGYTVCERLKADPITAGIPVIFMSSLDEVDHKVKAFDVGAIDYITKPFEEREVIARVRTQLALQSTQKEVQKLNSELEERVLQRTAELQQANQRLWAEVHQRQLIQEQLAHQAYHDNLTGLPNRALLMERLEQLVQQPSEQYKPFAVLFLDCDRFKLVNDTYGHLVGDQLLRVVAQRLEALLRPDDMVARLGGDEFMMILPQVMETETAIAIAQRCHETLCKPFCIEQREIVLGASIGIVLAHPNYQQPEMILRDADIAMYQAKDAGRSGYQVFTSSMYDQVRHMLEMEADLRVAIQQGQLAVHYQPIFAIADLRVVGFEALVRWYHPTLGAIRPDQFIPLAEETGLILPLGLWVLWTACQQLQTWQAQGLVSPATTMSVNVSARQFAQPDFVEHIDRLLAETGLAATALKLELTESVIMDRADMVKDRLHQLKYRQVQLSLDDFGTGYSSLSCLHQFPLDNLKIDRSFVQRIGEVGENLGILQAIASLAHHLNMSVVAEGIETVNQLQHLRAMGCAYGQGYWYAKPLPAAAMTQWLRSPLPHASIS